jgi:perosamine synthetase
MIQNLTCSNSSSLLDAMHIINENTLGVCFIVDEFNSLKGVVTDGDIRRAIMNNKALNSLLDEIANDDYVFGLEDEPIEELIRKINQKDIESDKKVTVIPIVDKKNNVVDYFQYSQKSHFPVAMPNLAGNELKYLTDAFLSTWVSSSGPYLDQFENLFSTYSDCKYGAAVSNGTAALHVALLALGIGPDDEVIIPDLTFAATINAVLHTNATPVIVDVEKESWCIDPIQIEKSITLKTKAIIPVHLYGQVCDMEKIMYLAKKYNLKVVEDCAEAHGAMFNNKKVGSLGDIGCFSFYGNKVLTTGEGGMCTSNSKALITQIKLLRDHGMSKSKRYFHEVVGYNYRMTNLQAAIGVAQLERADAIHKNRTSYENLYRKVMPTFFEFQKDIKGRGRITWLVSFLVNKNPNFNRDELISIFLEEGIDARPFFYTLSQMSIYTKYAHQVNVNAKEISRNGISLPTYESLKSLNEIENIVNNIFNKLG